MTLPLEGIRVLDLSRVLAGPLAAHNLARLRRRGNSVLEKLQLQRTRYGLSPEVVVEGLRTVYSTTQAT
jgi:crotonobetainyl-CoA:carnitine CoA-transferase CaiB-like acyl-CoA transferase